MEDVSILVLKQALSKKQKYKGTQQMNLYILIANPVDPVNESVPASPHYVLLLWFLQKVAFS